MEYRCYSDASSVGAGPVIGYGVVVLKIEDGIKSVVHHGSGTIECSTITEGELRAMLMALRVVPSDSSGIAYSDLLGINGIVRALKRERKHTAAADELRAELQRTGLVAEYIERYCRPAPYRDCHRMARQAIRKYIKGETGLDWNRMPKKKKKRLKNKWWTITWSSS